MAMVVTIINLLYYAIVILIFARIIMSFVQFGSYDLRFTIFRLTEPLLAPIRNILPPMGGFDFSPMVLLIAASLIRRLLFSALF
jgi:YggT family protein